MLNDIKNIDEKHQILDKCNPVEYCGCLSIKLEWKI